MGLIRTADDVLSSLVSTILPPALLITAQAILSPAKDLTAVDLAGKRVLLRGDLNCPLHGSTIADDSRARAMMPTLRILLQAGARVVIMSHLGRPKGGKFSAEFSLQPVAAWLEKELGPEVFVGLGGPEVVGPAVTERVLKLRNGQAFLLENTRFHAGDETGDEAFARELAQLADVYVNDAFGAAHRAHASVSVVALHFDDAHRFPGLLLRKEVKYLSEVLWRPKRPLATVVGGAKVADKLGVLRSLVALSDRLVIGGRMAYTFLAALGIQVGDTVIEKDRLADARAVLAEAEARGCKVFLPSDVIVGDNLDSPGNSTRIEPLTHGCCTSDRPCIAVGQVGGDIGPASCVSFRNALLDCKTVFWNGPLGRFETREYANGTLALAEVMDELSRKGVVTVIGGGDSVSAVMQFGLEGNITHISTGGGASLELIEGKSMPGIECLAPAKAQL